MKNFLATAFTFLCALAVSQPLMASPIDMESEGRTKILLGKKMETPYSVKNINKALKSLNSKGSSIHIKKNSIKATHHYIKITPTNEAHLAALAVLDKSSDSSIVLHDRPLDYDVAQEGDYYVSPKHEKDLYHPVYTVVPVGFKLPGNLPFIVQEGLYEPEEDEVELEDLSFQLINPISESTCGKNQLLCEKSLSKTVSSKGLFGRRYRPQGRVMILNTQTNTYEPLRRARISIGRSIWWRYTYTDNNGYFVSPKKYRGKVRIRSKWRSNVATIRKSWNEMLGVAVSDHLMTITRGSNGRTKNISFDESHLWYKGTIYNSLIKYNDYAAQSGISKPVSGANIWVWRNGRDVGSAPMLHRHKILPKMAQFAGLPQNQLWEQLVNSLILSAIDLLPSRLQPDIIFSGLQGRVVNGAVNTRVIEQRVFHEAAHFSHAIQSGAWYWAKLFSAELNNQIWQGDPYSDGTEPTLSAGKHIGVVEGWATLVEYKAMNSFYSVARNDNAWINPHNFIDDFNMYTVPMADERDDSNGWFLHGLFWDILDNSEPDTNYLNGQTNAPIDNSYGGNIVDEVFINDAKELLPIFKFLTSSISDACKFGSKLVSAYPIQGPDIEDLFHSYGFTCIDGGDGVQAPGIPAGFYIANNGNGHVSLKWNNTSSAGYYEVYSKVSGSSSYFYRGRVNTPGRQWSTYISQGTYFKIRACNTAGCSNYSPIRFAFRETNDCIGPQSNIPNSQPIGLIPVLCENRLREQSR